VSDTLNAVGAAVVADLQALAGVAGAQTTLSFDSTSIPTAVNSLLKDGQTLLTDAQLALSKVAQTSVTAALTYINAISTLVSLFEAELNAAPPVGATLKASPMTEPQALKTLKVR
jgi:hypothetical protein